MAQQMELDDSTAMEIADLYEPWEVGHDYKPGKIVKYGVNADNETQLYTVLQEHTSQEDWTPDAVPALYAVIDVTHAGTQDNPIPAERGMEYVYGLYYVDSEDGKLYLCQRTGEAAGDTVVLQYMPHELVGHYFVDV